MSAEIHESSEAPICDGYAAVWQHTPMSMLLEDVEEIPGSGKVAESWRCLECGRLEEFVVESEAAR